MFRIKNEFPSRNFCHFCVYCVGYIPVWIAEERKMKTLIPILFFVGLVAWGVSFGVIVLGHADLLPIGRDRTFGVATSLMFLITSIGGIFWAAAKSRILLTQMIIAFGIWMMAFFAFGIWPYALGMFGAPSEERIRQTAQANGYSDGWIEKALHGPARSAATSYMVDVYRWELLSEVKLPQ